MYEKKQNKAAKIYAERAMGWPLEKNDLAEAFEAGSDFGREYERGVEGHKISLLASKLRLAADGNDMSEIWDIVYELEAYNKSKDVKP